jgi:Glyoxalase superfamily protein
LLKLAIPLLHVSSSNVAEEFHCKRLGFRQEFAHRVDDAKSAPCYMGLSRDGIWLKFPYFQGTEFREVWSI